MFLFLHNVVLFRQLITFHLIFKVWQGNFFPYMLFLFSGLKNLHTKSCWWWIYIYIYIYIYIPTKINKNINRTKELIVIIVTSFLQKMFCDQFKKSSKVGLSLKVYKLILWSFLVLLPIFNFLRRPGA